MKLKGRLKSVADMTPVCANICDIGTDHAYVPIYLTLNKICERAIASDVREGPILAAKDNIRKYKLQEVIEARIGDGMESIETDEIDVVVIAGMGGILISEIIAKSFEKAQKARAMVLQPMNAIEVLREYLYKNGFDIYDEVMVNEGEKMYTVLAAKWTGTGRELNEINYYIGEKLIEKKDPLLKKYINRRINQVNTSINEIMKSNNIDTKLLESFIRLKGKLVNILRNQVKS